VARKRSHQTKLILLVLLDAPTEETYGLQVVRASGVGAGTCYAILRRLEEEGLLDARWEDLDPRSEGRPPRRYYRLNANGHVVASRETESDRYALQSLTPGWAPL
jgi:DNA-binding PadR family transcriptional regulator